MNARHDVDPELVDAVTAELRSGRVELEAMTAALDQAHAELTRARDRMGAGANPSESVREVLALILPEMGRPALLVDGDMWVVAANHGAAEALGSSDPEELAGSSLARWPHALERSKAVRHALGAPAGPTTTEHGDVVVSLGLDEAAAPSQQTVLVLLGA